LTIELNKIEFSKFPPRIKKFPGNSCREFLGWWIPGNFKWETDPWSTDLRQTDSHW